MTVAEMTERQEEARSLLEAEAREKDGVFPAGGPHVVLDDGAFAARDFKADMVGTRPSGNWPQVCTLDGVHPSQVKEAESESVKMGVPTHFTPQGGPIFESPRHRRNYYEGIGMYDRNAGPSDPVPKNR